MSIGSPERYPLSDKQERSGQDVPDGEASAADVMKRLMACFLHVAQDRRLRRLLLDQLG
jgi:hypothetical protein